MIDRVPDYAKFCPRCATPFVDAMLDGCRRPMCPSCHFVFYLDPKVAVASIIPLDGGVLLGRRATPPGVGRWSFPSGYVNQGEVLEAAAQREVLEEACIHVEVRRLVNVYSEAESPVVLVVYEAALVHGTPRAGSEMFEVGIFSPSDLPPMAFDRDYRVLQDWLALSPSAR